MPKRTTRGRGKASRRLPIPAQMLPESKVDREIFLFLVRYFTDNPPPIPQRADVRHDWGTWNQILWRVGSTKLLADYLETSEQNVNRWMKNVVNPSDLLQLKLRALASSLGLPSPV